MPNEQVASCALNSFSLIFVILLGFDVFKTHPRLDTALAKQLRVRLFVLFKSSQLSEARYDQVPQHFVLRVASNQEHLSGDASFQHLFALDVVVAKSLEDPNDIGFHFQSCLIA